MKTILTVLTQLKLQFPFNSNTSKTRLNSIVSKQFKLFSFCCYIYVRIKLDYIRLINKLGICSKPNFVQKIFRSKRIFDPRKVLSPKNVGSKKIRAHKNFESKKEKACKNLGPKLGR